ncbi:SIR2_2 domain-containing protein [Pseudomonas brassicacearum]|uniref:AVAST type 5 anti-phage protein Avs5 n=1 Tax=Pseudomonas brassicacearum TaxID=930166 RepID=UPI0039E3BF0F
MESIEIIHFSSEEAKGRIENLYRKSQLVPLLGAGFTLGCHSYKTTVPDAKALVEKLKAIVLTSENDISQEDLAEIGDLKTIFSIIDDETIVPKNKILKYFESAFTKVKIDESKRKFLKLAWPNIFTFNIDDAIERVIDESYSKVLPNKKINIDHLNSKKCFFKIHGDIQEYLNYQEKNLIFTWQEYAKSIDSNKGMLSYFSNIAVNGSVIFIGCSLDAEVDLLHLSTAHTFKKSIFVKKGKPNLKEKLKLKEYGIKTVLYFDSYDEIYSFFYEVLSPITIDSKFQDVKFLSGFNMNKEEVIKFIANGGPVVAKNNNANEINLPDVMVNRTLLSQQRDSIAKKPFTLITGRRFSGKTTFLAKIIRELSELDVYFLSSLDEFSSEIISLAETKEHTIFIFDNNSFTEKNIQEILKSIHIKSTNRFIFCTSRNDSEKINEILSSKRANFNCFEISNKLDRAESENLNERLNNLGLPRYNYENGRTENLLDFSYRIHHEYKSQLGSSNIFDKPITDEVFSILLLLILFDKVRSDQILSINAQFNVEKFIQHHSPIFEREDIPASIGYQIVCNTKTWIINTLKRFAKDVVKTSDLTAKLASELLASTHREAAYSIIKFDNLNEIFSTDKYGAAGIIRQVYSKLSNDFKATSHYWLQMAKCELMAGKTEEDIDNGIYSAKKIRVDLKKSDDRLNIKTYYSATLVMVQLLCRKYSFHKKDEILLEIIDSFIESLDDYENNFFYLEKIKTSFHKPRKPETRIAFESILNASTMNFLLKKDSIDKIRSFIMPDFKK